MNTSVNLEELKENDNTAITPKEMNENVDGPFTSDGYLCNANRSVSEESLDGHVDNSVSVDDFDENAFAHVSLNVIESELDMLNDDTTDDEKSNTAIDNNDNISEESIQNNKKEGKQKPKSQLHCAICDNYFEIPKLLLCLHTFCQACLKKGVKSHHKFIFCQICKQKSKIPKGGIERLADNVVAASLIKGMSNEIQLCMVCKLHNEIKASTGKCVDCGDTMCEDCCQKHTFSRLTAKHVVITLEKFEDGQSAKPMQKEEMISCRRHLDKTGEYFCKVCCIPVCNDCEMSDHKLHKCDLLEEATTGKKEFLKEKFDLFKQECDSKLVDDTDESRHLISEHKKKELEKLKNGKDALIAIIEEKFSKCAEDLQFEYNIKERKYCEHKKKHLDLQCSDVANLTKSILFMLNEGNDVQAAMLENTIMTAIEDKRLKMNKLCHKLTSKSFFPEVRVFKEHAKVLEGLTFFCTQHTYRVQKRTDQEIRMARSEMHLENGEIRMKLGQNVSNEVTNEQTRHRDFQSRNMMPDNRMQKTKPFQTMINSTSSINNDNYPPSLLSLNFSHARPSVGRGSDLMASPPMERGSNLKISSPIGRGSILKTGPNKKSSLLGEYTGQSRQSLMDVINDSCLQSNFNSFNSRNKPKNRGQNIMGKTFILDLSSSLDTSIIMDKKMPSNVDIAFISPQNFAVADIRNQRLKIFSIHGKLIKYIDDASPMYVTFCANHLLWSSQFSYVKLFDIQSQEIVRVHRVPKMAAHPLTSFMNVKYLIGNMDQHLVEACSIDGLLAHTIQPRDKYGVPLRDVLHIATCRSNQLVCVDRQLRKVVVNDFDGNFIGEFSQDGFEPGGVCITEHDNIFVTDKNRNKLLLLSPKADFIHDWNTVIDAPSCIASNLNGLIVVAGETRTASIYQYSTL